MVGYRPGGNESEAELGLCDKENEIVNGEARKLNEEIGQDIINWMEERLSSL